MKPSENSPTSTVGVRARGERPRLTPDERQALEAAIREGDGTNTELARRFHITPQRVGQIRAEQHRIGMEEFAREVYELVEDRQTASDVIALVDWLTFPKPKRTS